MTAIAEARRIDGQPAHRLIGSPAGAWITAKSPIDAILDRVQGQLGVNRSTVMCAVGMHHGSLSRCRHGELPMPDEWLLRLHLLSAIPVAELLKVGCIEHEIWPHIRARRPS